MRALPLSIPITFRRVEALRVSAPAVCLVAITLVALVLRVFWVLYMDTYPLGGDPHWYFIVAINISKGFGFVATRRNLYEVVGPGQATAFWPPGYSFALAALFKLSGVSVTHAMVMNAAFGAATVPFVYALGSAIFDRRVGLAAAALFAVFPNAIAWAPVLFAEELFTLIFVAALWLLVAQPLDGRRWLTIACFGLLAGMAVLTRGEGVVLFPIAAIFWLARWRVRTALRYAALAFAVAAMTIVPWTVRNAVEMRAFIPVSTNSATVFRIGHAPDATGDNKWTRDTVDGVPMETVHFQHDTEVKAYREFQRRAVKYALTHPKRELELSGLKLYHTYRSDVVVIPWVTTLDSTPFKPPGLHDPLWYLFTYSYYILFFAAVASVPIWLRRDPYRLLLGSVFLFWSLFHIAFSAEPRYHVPLYPAFAIAVAGGAALALDHARAAIGRRRSRSAGVAAAYGPPVV